MLTTQTYFCLQITIWFVALKWLPKTWPDNVYIILSTLHDSVQYPYGYLPKLQAVFKAHIDTKFLDVPLIPAEDAQTTVERWLYPLSISLVNTVQTQK